MNPARNFWRGLGWAAKTASEVGRADPLVHDSIRRENERRMSEQPMRVFVIRNEDGAVVEDVPSWMPHYTTGDVFWWTEGNMSCDCNRHLEFERGQGREPDAEDVECGHGRYSVRLEPEDGTVVE